jgi:DNA-binding transcriptional ArsR family regulator
VSHPLDILGDPVRRRILELLAGGERTSGEVVKVIRAEFGISQPAVSQHLRVLRENGFARVRPDGARRIYSLEPAPLQELDTWLEHFRAFWAHRLDALATEVARGKRKRAARNQAAATRDEPTTEPAPIPRRRRARR